MEIEYQLVGSKVRQREPLSKSLFHDLQPSLLQPMREMRNSHYKTNKPGLQYFESTGQLVAFESRIEGFNLLILDWEGNTSAIQGQPFTLHYKNKFGKKTWHVPDFMVAHSDGTVSVINVKPSNELVDPKVQDQFAAAAKACGLAGWQHRVMATPGEAFLSNLQFLANFKQETPICVDVMAALAAHPVKGALPVSEYVDHATTVSGLHPVLVRPVIMHALWTRQMICNLDQPLMGATRIAMNSGVQA
jgi:hypothetical protein